MKYSFDRWNPAGWPLLSVKPERLLAAARQQAALGAIDQVLARQEWDAARGAISR